MRAMTNPNVQHSVNAVVASAPVVSIWAHFPEAVTVIVGILAIIYYVIVIAEKIAGWRAKWLQVKQSSHRVMDTLTETANDIHDDPA